MKINQAIVPTGLFQFISFLRRAIFYAFFYIYLRIFLGLPNTLAALLGTMNLVGSTFGQLKIWGPRLNHQPSLAKRYVVRGELIAAVTYFIGYVGHSLFLGLGSKIGAAFYMIILFSILEIFWSMSDLGVRFLIAQASEGQHRGQVVGLIDGLGLLGQIIGFLLSGLLYRDGLGFSEGIIFYVVCILIACCAFVIQFYPLTEKPDDLIASVIPQNMRELLKIRSYVFFLLCFMVLIIGISASTQIFLYYSENPNGLNFNDQQLSYLLILFSLSGGLATPLAGRASDKIGRIPVIIVGSFLAAISYLLLFIVGNQPFLYITVIYSLLGACFALIQSVAFANTADILPEELRGTGFSLFNITLATGWGLAGFMIGGPVADLLEFLGYPTATAYRVVFLVSSIVILTGTLALIVYSMIAKRNLSLVDNDKNQMGY